MEDYLVISADLSHLTGAEADDFVDAAAELGLDVDELAPHLGVSTEVVVLASTTLGAVCAKLIEIAASSAAQKLWDLLKRLLRGKQEPQGIEDRQQRITFVWDEQAKRDGLVATAAMIKVCQAIAAIPDGTVLNWDPEAGQWSYASPA
jgi:hypothetical protein